MLGIQLIHVNEKVTQSALLNEMLIYVRVLIKRVLLFEPLSDELEFTQTYGEITFTINVSVVKLHLAILVFFIPEHDDVIKWKHFPRYWPFARGIHQSPVNSTHKGRWRGGLMFSLIRVWISGGLNNREAGDLRRHRAHYDVTEMEMEQPVNQRVSCSVVCLLQNIP